MKKKNTWVKKAIITLMSVLILGFVIGMTLIILSSFDIFQNVKQGTVLSVNKDKAIVEVMEELGDSRIFEINNYGIYGLEEEGMVYLKINGNKAKVSIKPIDKDVMLKIGTIMVISVASFPGIIVFIGMLVIMANIYKSKPLSVLGTVCFLVGVVILALYVQTSTLGFIIGILVGFGPFLFIELFYSLKKKKK